LRGFDWFSVGRRKFSQVINDRAVADGMSAREAYFEALRPFGGTQQLYYNLEFQFPLISEAKINGVVFYDIGDANDQLLVSNLRQDVGFGFRWYSPIGPLRFEWGFPLQRREDYGEDSVNFEFAIGAPF
jgi:outer membrane protein insertion porin family